MSRRLLYVLKFSFEIGLDYIVMVGVFPYLKRR